MTKYKIVIGIILTVVTLSCIIASSFAWFSANQSTVSGNGAGFTAMDPSVLTVSDDIHTIQDMGNYKGQTSFAFYRYIEDENNPAFEGKYILDKEGNKITKTFKAYDYDALLKENKEFVWNASKENVGIYNLKVTMSSVSNVSSGDRFLLKVKNAFDYSEPEDDFYLKNIDGNSLYITDTDGNDVYDNYFNSITINKTLKTITVRVSSAFFSCSIEGISQNYTTYSNSDNTTTVYDRMVSSDESKRYSVRGIDGSLSYDSKNEDTEISFDAESGVTNVSKIVKTDQGTCKKVYTDEEGNLNMEDKKYRIVKYVTETLEYYKIFDKALTPNCIYDGESENATISLTEKDILTYAIDDGHDMEDSAYSVAIQFEMLLKASPSKDYFFQFSANTVGIVPVRETAKELLTAIEGVKIGDVYYTYIDSDKVLFGLDVSYAYHNAFNKTTTIKNYEGEYSTVVNISMSPIQSNEAEYGKICYETTKGYEVYYTSDGGNTYQRLTYDLDVNSITKYVDIRGSKIEYDAERHGDLTYSLKTDKGYVLYIRDNDLYDNVFDKDGVLINLDYNDGIIFAYNEESERKCAVYTEINESNRARIEEGITNNSLYASQRNSTVYDAKGENVIYSSDLGNTIAATKRIMYFLPLTAFIDNFTLKVEFIDRTNISDSDWDNLSAEEKTQMSKTYGIDREGKIIDEDGTIVGFKASYENTPLRLYCVARLYYSDPYTFENLNSETELVYNYNYNMSTPMYTVESTGELKPFAYSDYAYMGSHFLIRLNVESGEKEVSE